MTLLGVMIKELEDRRTALSNDILGGGKNPQEYASLCGEIKGLNRAMSSIKEIETKYIDDDSE